MSVFEPFDSFSDIDDILFKLEDDDPGFVKSVLWSWQRPPAMTRSLTSSAH